MGFIRLCRPLPERNPETRQRNIPFRWNMNVPGEWWRRSQKRQHEIVFFVFFFRKAGIWVFFLHPFFSPIFLFFSALLTALCHIATASPHRPGTAILLLNCHCLFAEQSCLPGLHAEGVSETKTTTQSHTHSVKLSERLSVSSHSIKSQNMVPNERLSLRLIQMFLWQWSFLHFLYFNQAKKKQHTSCLSPRIDLGSRQRLKAALQLIWAAWSPVFVYLCEVTDLPRHVC